jgi:hypothetical protein
MKDRLFLLRQRFDDHGTSYFCPYSAHVVGFLAYFPEVRETLEIAELDFPRPRQPVVDMVGEENQALPILVLGGEPVAVPDVTIDEVNGHRFIKKTLSIIRYLAVTRGTPLPH